MKKTIILATLILAATSCTRESLSPDKEIPGADGLLATIVQSDQQTKAILLDNPGIRMESFWTAGEVIGVVGIDTNPVQFSVSAGDISGDGKTALFRSTENIPSGNLTAFSPYQEGANISDGKVFMDFPTVQHYTLGNGVAQPDPAANLMVGTGNATGGLSFRNATAILKIGQTFDQETVVKKVLFKDLSGAAVAGAASITPGLTPVASITGSESVITLDCGEEGVSVPAGKLARFYIIIPPRNYPKGAEITFITADGQSAVRTTGTSGGVTFDRSIIYPVGDIPNRDYVLPSAGQLAAGAILMTPELLRNVKILQMTMVPVQNDEGTQTVKDCNGNDVFLPSMDIYAPREMGFKEGNWLIFDATDDLPSGGVLKIKEIIEPFGDDNHALIKAQPTNNPFEAYQKLEVGSQMFDAEGQEIEGAGFDINMSDYLSEIRDGEGKKVPFHRNANGEIILDEGDVEDALSKAIIKTDNDFSSPTLSISNDGDHIKGSLEAKLTLSMRAAIKVQDCELHFITFSFEPSLNLSAKFSLEAEGNIGKDLHLFTLYFVPGIPITPGVVLTPQLDISAGIGIGGSIKLETSIDYTLSLGRFGFSYQPGDGFCFRHMKSAANPLEITPSLDASLKGSIYAYGSITATPRISLYGLFSAGLATEFSLKFGIEGGVQNDGWDYRKLFLQPGLKFTPVTASLGGLFSQKWDDFEKEQELDPIWERYLSPRIEGEGDLIGPTHLFRTTKYEADGHYYWIHCPNSLSAEYHSLPIFTHIDAYKYKVVSKVPTLDPWECVLQVFTGTPDIDESHMYWGLGLPYGGFLDNYFQAWADQGWKPSPNCTNYTLLDIPAGSDELEASGTVAENAFANGTWYSVIENYRNKRTGKYLFDPDKEQGLLFRVMWPTLPSGDYAYVTETISESLYDNLQCPVSSTIDVSPNGYHDIDL